MKKDYRLMREIKTGYYLSSEELARLTPEEKLARHKIMLDTRDEIRRLNEGLNVECPTEEEKDYEDDLN